jgi:hypothetical protein
MAMPGPLGVDVPNEDANGIKLKDGVLSIEQPDGGVSIDFNPDMADPEKKGSPGEEFYVNLANKIDEDKLNEIANDLIEGFERDLDSRKEWLATRTRGIQLLGLKIEEPRSGTGEGTAPIEGMSRVHHPLLLEATIRFQATARGELLPATGPIKIRNDSTLAPKSAQPLPPIAPPPPSPQQNLGMVPEGMPASGAGPAPGPPPPGMMPPGMPPPGVIPPPPQPGIGHNGGPDLEEDPDELAQALEKDMNHYLTVTAKEYIPDTDRMLFYVGFGGDGFKKVFNCPLRRRPVSESVDAEDLVVSNSATALPNCGRITHRIKMRKSILKRMQIIGAYRDVDLALPAPAAPNPVEAKKAEIQGQNTRMQRPQDQDYEILEIYCELDLDQFAPKDLRGEGLPLPYRVTIERDSRQVLSVIRNWEEEDDQALPKQFFVQFPFVRGLGFYGLGFIHILGNTTVALTALWREIIDAGMFANFPGFLYLKSLGRQLTNQFRVPPGGGVGIDGGPGQDIRQMVMALPYKEPGPATTAFTTHMEEVGQRLGMTGEMEVGEGKQDAPVGTTLALIEQATKIMDSAHKRLHAAQAEEFQLLKARFKEDPEAFWRHNKRPTKPWKKEQFLAALENHDLVPVADPNNPTSLHRVAKAMAVKQLQQGSPNLYNPKAVDQRIMRIVGIDPEGLFNETPTPDKPDPRLVAIQEKSKASEMQVQLGMMQARMQAATEQMRIQDAVKDRESRERISAAKQHLEETRLVIEQIRDSDNWNSENASRIQDMYSKQMANAADLENERRRMAMEENQGHAQLQQDGAQKTLELAHDHASSMLEHKHAQTQHETDMEHERQKHAQRMSHEQQLHTQRVEQAKALAAVAKQSKSKTAKGES